MIFSNLLKQVQSYFDPRINQWFENYFKNWTKENLKDLQQGIKDQDHCWLFSNEVQNILCKGWILNKKFN